MCLAIPMQIQQINGHSASCSARGITRDVNIFMFKQGELQSGDYVMVHVGYAIQKIDPTEAQLAWQTDNAMRNGEKDNVDA